VTRLVIIGGGIAGLSAAWAAVRPGAGVDVTLVERDERLGGKIRTDCIDSFLAGRPEALRLCEELGIAGRLVPRTPRNGGSFVRHGLALFPLQPMDISAPPIGAEGEDESVESSLVRRYGQEVYQRLVEPLVGGIHAGDAARLSSEALLPPPRRSNDPQGSTRPVFLAFPRGTAELVDALEGRLAGITILRGTGAESVQPSGNGYIVELEGGGRREADALVIAVPAHETARLVASLDPPMEELLGEIPCATTVVIHLAFRRADVTHPLDGYGYLIPGVENSDLVACTWTSQKWEGRAPDGFVMMRLFAGRFGRRDLSGCSDGELFEMARGELSATLGITAEPVLRRLHRWDRGMPQYTVGHVRRVRSLRARAAAFPGLFLAGASFEGVGIPQCVESGTRAAAGARDHFSKQGAHT
jgi:oxygen-dependent protoporphyrinogen oxidase